MPKLITYSTTNIMQIVEKVRSAESNIFEKFCDLPHIKHTAYVLICRVPPMAHDKLNGLPTTISGCIVCHVLHVRHTTNKGFCRVLEAAHGVLGTFAVCLNFCRVFFYLGTRQLLTLPCARQFSCVFLTAHGKICVCRVPVILGARQSHVFRSDIWLDRELRLDNPAIFLKVGTCISTYVHTCRHCRDESRSCSGAWLLNNNCSACFCVCHRGCMQGR